MDNLFDAIELIGSCKYCGCCIYEDNKNQCPQCLHLINIETMEGID